MDKEVLGVEGLERLASGTGSGDAQNGKTDTEAPSASENVSEVWTQEVTDDGQTYYYNTLTGEAQWEMPEGFLGEWKTSAQTESKNQKSSSCPWMEILSPDGYTYYYNTETGVSRWEKPAEFTALEEASRLEQGEGQDSSSPKPEPLPRDEERLTGGVSDAKDPRVLQRRKKEAGKSKEGDDEEEEDDDDDGDAAADENDDDKTTSPENEEEEVTPAKKARKTSPFTTGEQAEEEQDTNESSDLEEYEVKIKDRTIAPTVDKGPAIEKVGRKRKL